MVPNKNKKAAYNKDHQSIILIFSLERSTPSTSFKQVEPEAGITVVFHVLLASNFKMEGEYLHIRANGDDLGNFNLNCVDLEFVG